MLRSIREKLSGAFRTNARGKARRSAAPRRLNFESLECRELLTAGIAVGLASSGVLNAISDGSFEVPQLAANTFQYAPAGSPWQFSGSAGVSGNGSALTSGNPNAPDGTQVGFLQGTGSMSQSVYLDVGAYSLSFEAAQRAGSSQTHYQTLQVLVDGAQVALVTPASTGYSAYQTSDFTVTSGTHAVEFIGLNPLGGDNTAFVDVASISPEANWISDNSFEVPGLAAKTFQYAPAGSPWQFSGTAGVSSNGSTLTSSNPNAPDGLQVGFLQGTGSMSQSVNLGAGTYNLSFQAAQRAGSSQAHYQELQVLVDGAQVSLVTPADTQYRLYQTSNFTVTAGTHTVKLIGLNPLGGTNTALIDLVTILPEANAISDGSFEAPGLVAQTFQYGPNGSPWQFSGSAGVSGKGSAFTGSNPKAPDGTQVALLQGGGSMSQSAYLSAGTYSLSFLAAQRGGGSQAHYQELQVLVDGAQVGLVTPASTQYGLYQTANFTVTVGTHTVRFLGLNPLGGDNTAFVDEVVILPEANAISDGSFEAPGLAAKTFQYAPNGSPWQFSGSAGVSSSGSGFTKSSPTVPDGTQVAFLQGTGRMSQAVYLDAGTYSLSFLAVQRAAGANKHYQELQVLVDGAQVGLVTPANTQYGSYQTSSFTVTAGMHTVRFIGVNPLGGDNTAFVDQVALPAGNSISDSSFEVPGLAAKTFQYAPNDSPWQFSGAAGVSSNGSALTAGNPNAPDGSQVAFLQGNGSLSESVYLNAGSYSLSFQAAQRGGGAQAAYQEIQVLVGGLQVDLVTPASTQYGLYQTPSFTVTAGMHSVQLIGVNPLGGDNTAFVDQVAILGNVISDSSFEVPALTMNTFQYAPSGSAWQFTGSAGVSSDESNFTMGNPNALNGSQVAFLQGKGSISQSVYLNGGSYSLLFQAAQRADSSQAHYQELQVLVDGAQVGTVTPADTQYRFYQTSNFTEAAGMHTVELIGLNPLGGDNTAFVDLVAISPEANSIGDSSFEAPGLAAKTFQSAPNGSPWQFSGKAGVSSNGSAFTSGNPNATDGSQVAFLENTGSMSQSVYLDAGTYSLTFQAAQRAGSYQAHYQKLQVLVDGAQVGVVTPTSTQYGLYQTSNFTVTAGPHTVEFIGQNPLGGDNTAFVDQVAIAPEVNSISDSSFEAPGLVVDTFQSVPNGSPWQFSGSAGVAGNGSSLTSSNPDTPDGAQVAFLQGTGSMSQSVYLQAGTYSLSFLAAQCAGSAQTHNEKIQVLVDGAQVGLVTPTGAQYGFYQTSSFTVTDGMHVVALVGLNPLGGTNTAFVDDAQIY
jgi:uncharacterized protein YabE (DUF348 family)